MNWHGNLVICSWMLVRHRGDRSLTRGVATCPGIYQACMISPQITWDRLVFLNYVRKLNIRFVFILICKTSLYFRTEGHSLARPTNHQVRVGVRVGIRVGGTALPWACRGSSYGTTMRFHGGCHRRPRHGRSSAVICGHMFVARPWTAPETDDMK